MRPGATWRRSRRALRVGALEPGKLRIFFDLETSGLGTPEDHRARIVSIAAVVETAPYARLAEAVVRGGRPRGCFSSLVNPFGPQSSRAVQVHGLADELLASERGFAEVWEDFRAWAHREQELAERRHALREVLLVGHSSNSQDVPKLLSELRRAGLDVRGLLPPRSSARLAFEDTYPLKMSSRDRLRSALSSPSLRLSDVYASACGPSSSARAHDALWDAAALRDAWLRSEALRLASWRRDLDEALAHWARRK